MASRIRQEAKSTAESYLAPPHPPDFAILFLPVEGLYAEVLRQRPVAEWQQALEAAGAVGAEIEVVPARVTAEISKRTSLIMLSMGAGTGGDAQYLFSEDVLGYTRVHQPRHAKVYRNFRAEYDRLQQERIAAFKEFAADVDSGAYPEEKHVVRMTEQELTSFCAMMAKRT